MVEVVGSSPIVITTLKAYYLGLSSNVLTIIINQLLADASQIASRYLKYIHRTINTVTGSGVGCRKMTK